MPSKSKYASESRHRLDQAKLMCRNSTSSYFHPGLRQAPYKPTSLSVFTLVPIPVGAMVDVIHYSRSRQQNC